MEDNLTSITKLNQHHCYSCKEKGLFCRTPNGGEYITCPFCSKHLDVYECKYINIGSKQNNLHICDSCDNMFDSHCEHAVNGCSEDVTYARFITKVYIDGVCSEGTPKYKYIEKLLYDGSKIVLAIDCWSSISPNGRTFCEKAYYKYNDNKKYYHVTNKCEQIKKQIISIKMGF